MTLSSALNIVDSSFRAIGTDSATIASNISNANTTGYSAEVANLGTTPIDTGVTVVSITRDANAALTQQANLATSESAMQSAISTGLTTLAQTVSDSSDATTSSGALSNGASPAAMLANLQGALTTYEADPSSATSAQAAVSAAHSLASSLNSGAQTVTQVRTQADQQIATDVNSVNTLLGQLTSVNNSIVSGLASGANVGAFDDKRDSLVAQISKYLGVTTSINSNGSMAIFTDAGQTLFQGAPYDLSFQPSGDLGAGATGAQVTLNGVPITGASANNPVQSGEIAGLVQLRDVVAPQYGAQLDQIAGNLISAFQETDQSTTNPGLPAKPGLFTTSGLASVPTPANYTGLAGAIEVNPAVDPSQGGDPTLLRDGGVNGANYSDNPSGAASYTGNLQKMIAAMQSPMTFASSAGLPTSASLSNYADSSVSWLQSTNQQASNNATYQSSLLSQANSALSNATGVNLDNELTNMLTIESSYTASAKLLTSVQSMLESLVNAV